MGAFAAGATWCKQRIQTTTKDPTYDTICPRCKRDVGHPGYARACGKGAAEFARLLQELAEKRTEKGDALKVANKSLPREYIYRYESSSLSTLRKLLARPN